MPLRIESLKNPRVKHVVKLRDRRDREREGLFLIEGYRELLRALENDYPVQEVFYCTALWRGGNEQRLVDSLAAAGAELLETTEPVFRKMAYRDRPEGLIGVAPQRRRELTDVTLGDPPFLLVAEAIEKPGNLGTMLRTADAGGVDALVVCNRCTDIFNPNVVRASTGTLFTVSLAETTSAEALDWLRRNRIAVVAATPHTDVFYDQVDLTGPVAVVVGTEQYGLSDDWLAQADLQVRIPMLGVADSLNVAAATTILLYEVVRQRGRRA